MKTFTLYPSDNKNKRFKVYIKTKTNIKKIQFGSSNHSNFTEHKDEERRLRYLKRHEKNENWSDYTTPGFWAYRILWNKPTLRASYIDTLKKFNLKPENIPN